jgi:hypothetical protein
MLSACRGHVEVVGRAKRMQARRLDLHRRFGRFVWLPVPFMPATNHVSSIVSSDIGMSERPKFTVSPLSPTT